ncbi:COQ9 family protein [Siccirubricoccus sp. G192]|uniref:COQ9 family protein n=1 Tax=Siccirubricoccus sp. G192 TaxID=2849651 RepID=UPI001C2C88D9|nr:COQ9 family protein [Siccirubricoccus sp. G192]MBV1796363.1 COQ9 family protein [Siccirubricoccus sp. G192]
MIERSASRDAAIRAMLPIAAEQGWNWASLRAGLAAAGQEPDLAASHFPTGPVGAIAAWSDLADREMEAAAAAEDLAGRRVPARIRRVVELRLAALAPHKPALRRAMSRLALPWHAGLALCLTARTADALWHAAGDRSADFSWYTRRASLGAIYAATLAYWLRDDDPGLAAAMAFLDRRLADLGRLQRRKPARRKAADQAAA